MEGEEVQPLQIHWEFRNNITYFYPKTPFQMFPGKGGGKGHGKRNGKGKGGGKGRKLTLSPVDGAFQSPEHASMAVGGGASYERSTF